MQMIANHRKRGRKLFISNFKAFLFCELKWESWLDILNVLKSKSCTLVYFFSIYVTNDTQIYVYYCYYQYITNILWYQKTIEGYAPFLALLTTDGVLIRKSIRNIWKKDCYFVIRCCWGFSSINIIFLLDFFLAKVFLVAMSIMWKLCAQQCWLISPSKAIKIARYSNNFH